MELRNVDVRLTDEDEVVEYVNVPLVEVREHPWFPPDALGSDPLTLRGWFLRTGRWLFRTEGGGVFFFVSTLVVIVACDSIKGLVNHIGLTFDFFARLVIFGLAMVFGFRTMRNLKGLLGG